VHTYTHPYMTSLTNEAIVAQLGYTMMAISDLTGGRVPRFWRPPYGDSDMRVRAIALEVFGLTTIIWNNEWVLRAVYSIYN
jgi:chitin deacetylase